MSEDKNPFTKEIERIDAYQFLKAGSAMLREEAMPKSSPEFPYPLQKIYGNVPSKSNGYRIVTIPGKNGKRGFSSLAKTKILTEYEKAFYIQCNYYRNANIEGYIEFSMDVYYDSQRPDLDGSLKVILDCLQKVKALPNDNKVVALHIRKFLDKANPRVEFWIKKAME